MCGAPVTRPPDFEARYRDIGDPWRVETSWYERRKLAVLMACLPQQRYERAWEPGCGIGVTTEALAGRVGSLVASDPSATAVARTADRVQHLTHVRVAESALPEVPLPEKVDLVVVAEFLYYLDDATEAIAAVWDSCAPGAHVVVLHWSHHPHDAFRSGEQTQIEVADDARRRGATCLVSHLEADFRLDVYEVAS